MEAHRRVGGMVSAIEKGYLLARDRRERLPLPAHLVDAEALMVGMNRFVTAAGA